jgi:hypothetical protein
VFEALPCGSNVRLYCTVDWSGKDLLFLQIYLGQTVAEKYGPSGKTCLGGAVFPTDYLTDVAMGRNASEVKAQRRYVSYSSSSSSKQPFLSHSLP